MDCIFCKIAKGEQPTEIVYKDDDVIVFPDMHPVAPVHLLIIPRKHIPSVSHLTEADSHLIVHMVNVANQMAIFKDVSETGYRLVINSGEYSGQVIQHLHMHLLGGRRLSAKMSG
jgi:histidine triad (HIT) family protein